MKICKPFCITRNLRHSLSKMEDFHGNGSRKRGLNLEFISDRGAKRKSQIKFGDLSCNTIETNEKRQQLKAVDGINTLQAKDALKSAPQIYVYDEGTDSYSPCRAVVDEDQEGVAEEVVGGDMSSDDDLNDIGERSYAMETESTKFHPRSHFDHNTLIKQCDVSGFSSRFSRHIGGGGAFYVASDCDGDIEDEDEITAKYLNSSETNAICEEEEEKLELELEPYNTLDHLDSTIDTDKDFKLVSGGGRYPFSTLLTNPGDCSQLTPACPHEAMAARSRLAAKQMRRVDAVDVVVEELIRKSRRISVEEANVHQYGENLKSALTPSALIRGPIDLSGAVPPLPNPLIDKKHGLHGMHGLGVKSTYIYNTPPTKSPSILSFPPIFTSADVDAAGGGRVVGTPGSCSKNRDFLGECGSILGELECGEEIESEYDNSCTDEGYMNTNTNTNINTWGGRGRGRGKGSGGDEPFQPWQRGKRGGTWGGLANDPSHQSFVYSMQEQQQQHQHEKDKQVQVQEEEGGIDSGSMDGIDD